MDTYIITVVEKELNVGEQHIREGWSEAVKIAVRTTQNMLAAGTHTDRDQFIEESFENHQRYNDPVGNWSVVIGQPLGKPWV